MPKKIANTGDFLSRIEENIQNGWSYPNRVVRHVVHGGKWSHYISWYLCRDNKLEFLCGGWSNTTACTEHPDLEKFKLQYGVSYLQTFVKERK